MNSRVKRIAKKGIVITLSAALAAGVIDHAGMQETQAQEKSLPGIEKIVAEHENSGEIFHILEVVSDRSYANIGYLIGGEEPVSGGRKLSQMPSAGERSASMEEFRNTYDSLNLGGMLSVPGEAYVESEDGDRSVEIRGKFIADPAGEYNYLFNDTKYRPYDSDRDTVTNLKRYYRYITVNIVPGDASGDLNRYIPTYTKLSQTSSYPDLTIVDEGNVSNARTDSGKQTDRYTINIHKQISRVTVADFAPDDYVGREVYYASADSYTYSGYIVKGKPENMTIIDGANTGTVTDPDAASASYRYSTVTVSDPDASGNVALLSADSNGTLTNELGTIDQDNCVYIVNAADNTATLWVECYNKQDDTGNTVVNYSIRDISGSEDLYTASVSIGGDYAVLSLTRNDYGNLTFTEEYVEDIAGNYVVDSVGSIDVKKIGVDQDFDEAEEARFRFAGSYEDEAIVTVSYSGGIVNNEWFKYNVLNLSANTGDNGTDEVSGFRVEVTTITYSELADLADPDRDAYFGINLDDVDFIYLSGQGMNGSEVSNIGNAALKLAKLAFGAGDDGSVTFTSRVPVVMDYAFYENSGADSYLKKLSLLLLQAENETVAEQVAGMDVNAMSGLSVSDMINTVNRQISFKTGLIYEDNKNALLHREYLAGNVYMFDSARYAGADYLDEVGNADGLYDEVLEEIRNENFIINNSDPTAQKLKEEINRATITRYIMNWSRQRASVKDALNVLDLEPCYDFSGPDTLTDSMVRSYMGMADYSGQINITQMASAEFIGKIEDLNEKYDLIYVGARVGAMNTDEGGNTLYNDKSMTGLIYTHVGDSYDYKGEKGNKDSKGKGYYDELRLKDDSLYGDKANAGESDVYRSPGNDMNSTREEEFEQFIQAGYPVIFSSKLITVSGDSVKPNTTTVDVNSYFYDLLEFALKKTDGEYDYWQKNVYTDDQLIGSDAQTLERQSTFCRYLNLSKLEINWVDNLGEACMPVEYDEDKASDERFLKPSGGHYYLQYIFSLENESAASQVSTTYDCKLYVDNNSDGRFSGSDYSVNRNNDASEELKGLSVYVRNGNEWNEVDQVVVNDVARYELYTGRVYKVERQVPDDYQGMLPWKLVFYDNANILVRTAKSGYTAVNRDTLAPINVLQLMSDAKVSSPKKNWNLEDDEEVEELLKKVPGFDVSISSVKVSSFISDTMASYNIEKTSYNKDSTEFYEKIYNAVSAELKKYDMVIMGFGDNYKFGTTDKNFASGKADEYANMAAAEAVRDYIEDGNSVLFTHDSSSYINTRDSNVVNQSWYWGYEFNKTLRASVGLDRYGALKEYYRVQSEDSNIPERLRERYKAYYDVLNDTDKYQYDTLTKPGTEGATLTNKEGLTKYTVVRYMRNHLLNLIADAEDKPGEKVTISGESSFYFPVKNELLASAVYKPANTALSSMAGSALTGTYAKYGSSSEPGARLVATMVNEGQITNYPFKISDDELRTLTVADTHYQWLQPNMEIDKDHDGKNDIVVWYCLSDLESSAKDKKYSDDRSYNNIYNICPNDVVNNYYIYNMGNVTYSGAGHTEPEDAAEKKLFINTMVAAYSAGVKAPGVDFKDESGNSVDSVFMMYDRENSIVLGSDDNVNVKLETVDYNILSGMTGIRLEFFMAASENTPGAIKVSGITDTGSADWVVPINGNLLQINVSGAGTKLGQETLTAANSMDGYFKGDYYMVQSDVTYDVSIPRNCLGLFSTYNGEITDILPNASASSIIVRATTIYDSGNKHTESSIQTLSVSVAELFDLK